MKLPDQHKITVSDVKVKGYLLSNSHPYGRHKAAFFNSFGFEAERWELMAYALREHAKQNELAGVEENEFGKRYIVEGPLVSPDGRAPIVRVVWFVEKGDDCPRLVTVYPL